MPDLNGYLYMLNDTYTVKKASNCWSNDESQTNKYLPNALLTNENHLSRSSQIYISRMVKLNKHCIQTFQLIDGDVMETFLKYYEVKIVTATVISMHCGSLEETYEIIWNKGGDCQGNISILWAF